MPRPDIAQAQNNIEASWDALFPAEQVRIVGLLVECAELHPDGLELAFRVSGLAALAQEAVPARIVSMEEV